MNSLITELIRFGEWLEVGGRCLAFLICMSGFFGGVSVVIHALGSGLAKIILALRAKSEDLYD